MAPNGGTFRGLLMSESNATAVAEPEQQQPTDASAAPESQTPPVQAEAPPVPSAEDTAGEQAPSGESTPSAEGAAEAEGFDAALAKVRGKPAEPKRELPGRSVDDDIAQIDTQRAQKYAEILQYADQRDIMPYLREELGLDGEAANQVWQKVRPYIAELHTTNQAHNLSMLDTLLRQTLSEDERKILDDRTYLVRDDQGRVKPYSSMSEGMKLAMAAREERVNHDWQEKIDKGEYLSREDAEKVAEAMIAVERSKWEKSGAGSSSGQTTNGRAADTRSEQEILMDPNTPVEVLKQIRDRQEGRG